MTDAATPFRDPLFDIQGRVHLVAGAGGGLGGAIARALAERGAKLVLCDTDAVRLAAIGSSLPGAVCAVADINDEAANRRMADLACERFGRLDGAVNAAGVLPIDAAATLDEAVFRQCMDVNVTGALLFSRAAARAMDAAGGRIVHIASVSSFVANPNYAAYATSKAALAQLVRVLAREWAPRNILVNAIGPALTETPLTQGYLSDPTFLKNAVAAIPMGRLGEVEDIIGATLLLLAPGGGFITGQTLYVDGGRTLV